MTRTTMNNPAPCMRPKEAAAFLGCGISTLWRWTKQGLLPEPQRIGARFTYWRREDLEAFIGLRGTKEEA